VWAFYNIQSLNPLNAHRTLLFLQNHSLDGIGLQETWLKPQNLHERILPAYKLWCSPPLLTADANLKLRASSGTGFYTKSSLQASSLPDNLVHDFMFGIKVPCTTQALHICTFYSGILTAAADRSTRWKALRQWCSRWNTHGPLLIGIDVNGDPRDPRHPSSNWTHLTKLIDRFQLAIVNLSAQGDPSPTCFTPSCPAGRLIDTIVCSQSILPLVTKMLVMPPFSGSPHRPLLIKLALTPCTGGIRPQSTPEIRYNHDRLPPQQLGETVRLALIPLASTWCGKFKYMQPSAVNDLVHTWSASVTASIKKAVGTRPVFKHSRPCVDPATLSCLRTHRKLRKHSARARSRGLVTEALRCAKLAQSAETEAKRRIRQLKQRKSTKRLLALKADPGSLWKYLRRRSPKSTFPPPHINSQEGPISGHLAIQALASKAIESLPLPSACDTVWITQIETDLALPRIAVTDLEADAPITSEEIATAIRKLGPTTSPGADAIVPFMLKHGGPPMLDMLTSLFNSLWENRTVPHSWCRGLVSMIYKSGDRHCLDNYRPITVLPLVANLLNAILCKRLLSWSEKSGALSDLQGGFRHNRSCDELIAALRMSCETRHSRGEPTYLAFIDLRKAFDSVHKPSLLWKLRSLLVPSKLYDIINLKLSLDSASVKVPSTVPSWFHKVTGVPQGDPLSPLLFILFINDLVDDLQTAGLGLDWGYGPCPLFLFADDIVLTAPTEADLLAMLQILTRFVNKWCLAFNCGKSSVLIFGRHPLHIPRQWPLGDSWLSEASTYKYLGVSFSDSPLGSTFEFHTDKIVQAGKACVASLRELGLGSDSMTTADSRKLCISHLRPLLDYASGSWSRLLEPAIDALWLKAMRLISGQPRCSPTLPLLYELGVLPMSLRFCYLRLRLLHRILTGPSHAVRASFIAARSLHAARPLTGSLLSLFHSTLLTLGLGHLWDSLREITELPAPQWSTLVTSAVHAKWRSQVHDYVSQHPSPSFHLFHQSFLLQRPPTKPASCATFASISLRTFSFALRSGGLATQTCTQSVRWTLSVPGSPLCQLCKEAEESFEHLFCCPSLMAQRSSLSIPPFALAKFLLCDEPTYVLWHRLWEARCALLRKPRMRPDP